GYVAQHHPDLLREIQLAGHDIACHGFMHQPIYEQDRATFQEDVHAAKCLIEDLIGQRVIGYRAPAYSITARSLWALDVLIAEGFEYDSSIFPIHHDVYGIPNALRMAHSLPSPSGQVIYEFPIATARWGRINMPLGGGYMR